MCVKLNSIDDSEIRYIMLCVKAMYQHQNDVSKLHTRI